MKLYLGNNSWHFISTSEKLVGKDTILIKRFYDRKFLLAKTKAIDGWPLGLSRSPSYFRLRTSYPWLRWSVVVAPILNCFQVWSFVFKISSMFHFLHHVLTIMKLTSFISKKSEKYPWVWLLLMSFYLYTKYFPLRVTVLWITISNSPHGYSFHCTLKIYPQTESHEQNFS